MARTLLVISLCLLVLLSSCAKLEEAGYEAGKKIGSGLLGEAPEEDSVDLFCIRKASDALQNNVELLAIGDDWFLKSYEFSDGSVDSGVSIRYRLGNKEGERLNYWYPDNFIERNHVKYSQQQVNDVGLIEGDFSFQALLILEKTNATSRILSDTQFGNAVEAAPFKVVSREISNCNKP